MAQSVKHASAARMVPGSSLCHSLLSLVKVEELSNGSEKKLEVSDTQKTYVQV